MNMYIYVTYIHKATYIYIYMNRLIFNIPIEGRCVGGGGATQNPAFPRGEGMCVVAALTLPMACLPPL